MVIAHRFRLSGAEYYRLRQLGALFGLTRERVRQIERQGIDAVQTWLNDPAIFSPHVGAQPAVANAVEGLRATMLSLDDGPWSNRDLTVAVNRQLESPDTEMDPAGRLIAAAMGVARVAVGGKLEPIWARRDADVSALTRLVRAVHEALFASATRTLTAAELTEAVNRKRPAASSVSMEDVAIAAELASTCERLSDGRYRVRFECLPRRSDQLERVLSMYGEPTHVREIVVEVNRRLVASGGRTITARTASAHMSNSGRFVPIGKSGFWALRAWPEVETGTVLQLLERALVEANGPLSLSALHDYVASRRTVSPASVGLYMSTKERFTRVGRDQWALSRWSHALPGGGSGGAVSVKRRHRPRGRGKVMQSLRAAVIDELAAEPGGEMALAELRDRVITLLPALSSSTFYSYVRQIGAVETVAVEGSQGKRIRLTAEAGES
jgi:hypothetical protein